MSHQIYELMVLGMHPAILYPRRSQFRPRRGFTPAKARWRAKAGQSRSFSLRHEAGTPKGAPYLGAGTPKGAPCLRVVKRFEHGRVQAPDEIAHHALAVFVGFHACRRMSRPANNGQRQE